MRIGAVILIDRSYRRGLSNGVLISSIRPFQFTKITKTGFETTHDRTDSKLYDYIYN